MNKCYALILLLCITFSCTDMDKKRKGTLPLPNIDSVSSLPYDLPEENFPLDERAEIDLQPLFPPAEDQIEQGACTPFTIAYGLISYYEKRRGGYSYEVNNGRANPKRVFSPSFVFNSIKSTSSDCESGVDFTSTFSFINKNGVCYWHDFPYNGGLSACSKRPDENLFVKAKKFNGYRFFRIDNSLNSIKNYLRSGLPIIMGVYTSKKMDEEGYNCSKDRPFVWSPTSSDITEYHAMLCVGYKDGLGLKLLNSWGSDWGVDGYCYLSYNKVSERVREFYIARIQRAQDSPNSLNAADSTSFDLTDIKDNVFEEIVTNIPDSSAYFIKELSEGRHLDSMFRRDYDMLIKLKKKTKQQLELIYQLRTHLEKSE